MGAITGLGDADAAALADVTVGARRRWRIHAGQPGQALVELLHVIDDGARLWAVTTDDDHVRLGPVTATVVWDTLVTLLVPTHQAPLC